MAIWAQSFETFTFHLSSEKDVRELGEAFAQAISLESVNFELSIVFGLSGDTGAGKTTFVKGMLRGFFSDITVDSLNAEPFYGFCEPLGHVTHYDAKDDSDFVPHEDDHALIIIEHIEETNYDPTVSCDVEVVSDGTRVFQMEIPRELLEEKTVQHFLHQTQHMRMLLAA